MESLPLSFFLLSCILFLEDIPLLFHRAFPRYWVLWSWVMSTAALITLVRSGGNQVRRRVLLGSRLLQDDRRLTLTCHGSTSEPRCSRFDPDGSGCPATWDNFGIWDNRIDEPILLPPSIKYGKPIPQISLANVGCASHIGKRKENEDRFGFARLTDDVLYFAVYDGHGGPAAADFCHTHMEKCIKYVQWLSLLTFQFVLYFVFNLLLGWEVHCWQLLIGFILLFYEQAVA